MTHLPWMQIYIGDELAEAQALSAEEYGAHMLLRLHQWQHGELPSDEDRLMRITRVDRDRWPDIRNALAPMFDWVWHHARTANVRKQSEAKHANLSANGKKGGRGNKADGKPMESPAYDRYKAEYKADGKQSQPQSQSPSYSESPLSSGSEPPRENLALDKGKEDTYTRPLPKPKTLEEGKTILISRGCPPEEMKKCLDMYMAGHLTLYDIEPWDTEARASA